MPRIKTLRLVTPGKQRNGQTVTAQHLKEVVESYNSSARPPITLGHPSDSGNLAYGRCVKPRIEDGALVLDVHYTPVLETLEDQGYVEGFSAGIYPHQGTGKYYLHHVAALGELPPAADIQNLETKTLSAAALDDIDDPDKLILLSAEPEQESEMDEEKVKKLLADAISPLTDKVTALEEKWKGKKTDEPKSKEPPPVDEDTKKQLSVAMDTIKADRINAIKASAMAKGLSEDQIKPLMSMLNKADPVELADSGEDGLYTYAVAFVDGLDEPAEQGDLDQPLELADDAGKAVDLGDLANKF